MPRQIPELAWAEVHVTVEEVLAELGEPGRPPTEGEVIESFESLSVYDCLRVIAMIDIGLVVHHARSSPEGQEKLIESVAGPAPRLKEGLLRLHRKGRVVFFEQQVYHASRLAIRYASDRPPDGFGDGKLVGEFLHAFFGVPDLFETDLRGEDTHAALLSFELRGVAMNQTQSRMFQWGFAYEIFLRIWEEMDHAPDADEAFRRYSGLSFNQYLSIGFAIGGSFNHEDEAGTVSGRCQVEDWFRSAAVEESAWRAYLATSASTVGDLRQALAVEEQEAGATTTLSLAIEKTPLIKGPDGWLYVVNFAAFERKATQGIFHMLAEGAEKEGLDREMWTTPFGAAFQVWAEASVRRMEGKNSEVTIVADEAYGPKKRRRDSPDVVLSYERQMVVVEVVAGALQMRTITRGDLVAFVIDLKKFVLKKSDQLTKRIIDILNGDAVSIGLDPKEIGRYWPVIVTSVPFPLRPEVMKRIRRELKKNHLLTNKKVGPISILGAEELVALEAYLDINQDSILQVIVDWKHHPATGDHLLKNFLWNRGRRGGAPQHTVEMFREASVAMTEYLFPKGADSRAG